MDPSVSGDPWYPLECICRKRCGGCFMQFIGSVFEVRRICFIRRVRRGVSGDVGCLHMSIGLKIGVFWMSSENYACVIAYE